MGKKSRFLEYKKTKKSNKGATRERSASSQEKLECTKETVLSEGGYFNPDFGGITSEILQGNYRSDIFNSNTVKKERTRLSDESSFFGEIEGASQIMPSRASNDSILTDSITVTLPMENAGEMATVQECGKRTKDNSFQVFVRIRPLDDTAPDTSSTRLRSLSVESDTQVLLCTRPSKGKESNGTKHLFTFAHVFPEGSPQRDVFEITTQSLVDSVLTGHRACVISYGIPNSGKSYTLYGKATSGKHRGIIMRAMENMFTIVNSNKNQNVSYRLTSSFLQIYNEKFYDLLDPSASDGIKFSETGNITTLQGATELNVKTVDEISKQLRKSPNRMRDAGSRSHTVFTVRVVREEIIESAEQDQASSQDGAGRVQITEGELRFVDLVGVERSVKHASYDSPAVGTAEAKTAKSLQLFANLVLCCANDNNAVAPFRDSKLTRLLRNTIGGDCMTRLILTASPCPSLAHETLSCLQFGQKACGIVNQPYVKVNVVDRSKNEECDEEAPNGEKQPETPRPKSQSPSGYKLPPIHSSSSHHMSTDGEEDSTINSETDLQRERRDSTPFDEAIDMSSTGVASASSGVFSCSSVEERSELTPEAMYVQVKSTEAQNKVVQLPLLSSGTGKIFAQQTPKGSEKQRHTKSPTEAGRKRSGRKQKSSEKPGKHSYKTDFASTIQPAADYIINGGEVRSRPSTNSAQRNMVLESPRPLSSTTQDNDKVCCAECKLREDKIKADYDRMILFSKKDRDDKQAKLEDQQLEIKKLKAESVPLNQIRLLEDQVSQDKMEKEIQAREIVRLESLVETMKAKLSGMVSSTELTAIQELRRKEHQTAEALKKDIECLKLKLKDEVEKFRREMSNKTDSVKKMEREICHLKKEVSDKEKSLLDFKKQQEEKSANVFVEMNRLQTRHDAIVAELNAKLLSSTKEITKMKETETLLAKQRQDEKENLDRELGFARQTASQAQAELKIAHGKLVSLEREQRVARSANQNASLAQMSSRTSLRRSMDYRDTGTAMSNSPDSETDGACVTCGRQLGRHDISSDISRDEELRILLLQDARNREILIQVKRERNLLCDVMKIMYCRQWFQEEALPHIKRTLRRVGIDTKSLNTLKKKF